MDQIQGALRVLSPYGTTCLTFDVRGWVIFQFFRSTRSVLFESAFEQNGYVWTGL